MNNHADKEEFDDVVEFSIPIAGEGDTTPEDDDRESMYDRESNLGDIDNNNNKNDIGHQDDTQEETKATRRTYIIALLLLLIGAGASACFLYVGITSAQTTETERFERHANDLTKEIVSSFRDYETATAWIHEACRDWRDGSFSRKDFRVLYNYIIDGGLDFFLAEWVPNITHSERPALEAETSLYYENDPNVDYRGLLGLGPNPENPEEFGLFPRTNQSYYFPIQYLEPYEHIGDATHLDLYSISYEREAIDLAVETFEPVLTERFVIVSQETDGYSVSLIHPGVRLPDDIHVEPKDLSLMLIHIRSLLARAARFQGVSLAVYLFDATKTKLDGSPQQYLGGAEILVTDDDEKDVTYYSETELEDVQAGAGLYFEKEMKAGQRDWTIAIVPVDDTYESNNLFAILGGVMIFTATLLLAIVWLMHNRRRSKHVKKIIKQAAAESAIVSSLFPKNVRERLLRENATDSPHLATKGNEATKSIQSDQLHSQTNRSQTTSSDLIDDDMPIAEVYPHTTVLFADLAGFTAWSSKREPQTVFKLLETFYQAFDAIALRKKVFKVETIGDCYVAVTGLPVAQPKHAIIMALFAMECMKKLRELVRKLAGELGEDTLDMQMRVGLHSGPVTAGVLRGSKSRFQLFGDTVNTASRMESNGSKGHIHCSQDTADALIQGGKGHWLTAREDKVMPKGKGEMQTYWVHAFSTTRSVCTTSDESTSSDACSTDSGNNTASNEEVEEVRLPVVEAQKLRDEYSTYSGTEMDQGKTSPTYVEEQQKLDEQDDSPRKMRGVVKGSIASYCG